MTTSVTHAPDRDRYEITVDGALAGSSHYRREDGVVVFTHTEVADEYEGRGIGGQLVRGALDDVRAQGLEVVPQCPFVRAWIDRHEDYADLVRDG